MRIWQLHIPIDDDTRKYWRKRAKLLDISPAELVGKILTQAHQEGISIRDPGPEGTPNSVGSWNEVTALASFHRKDDPHVVPVKASLEGKPETLSERTNRNFDFNKCPGAVVRVINFQETREELFQELIRKYSFPGDFLDGDCFLSYGKFIDSFKWFTTQEENELNEAKQRRSDLLATWREQREAILRDVSEANKLVESSEGRAKRLAKVKHRSLIAELQSFEEKTRWHLREW